jgi:FkbM family methyltransferase
MSIFLAFRQYYSLFGLKGVVYALRSRLTQRNEEVAVMSPDLPHPLFLRLRSSDVTLLRSILIESELELPLEAPPRVIVDAGANVGFASIYFANKYPESTIIAIEPERSNYDLLKKNSTQYKNIKTVNAALWAEEGQVQVVDRGLGSWAYQTCSLEEKTPYERSRGIVSTVTMSSIMTNFGLKHVDLLKIDIEGSEKTVFEHSAGWLSRIGMIAIEVHEELAPGSSDSVFGAAQDFEITLRRGDMVVLSRRQGSRSPASQSGSVVPRMTSQHGRRSLGLPLRIIKEA